MNTRARDDDARLNTLIDNYANERRNKRLTQLAETVPDCKAEIHYIHIIRKRKKMES